MSDLPPPSEEAPISWWPEGYDLPAFRVKRESYGLSHGGDWTRGSSVTTLAHTALRYPSTAGGTADETSRGLLFVRPFDYNTTEIRWGWPDQYADSWKEVALVRSAFGHPSTPQDGETVFRSMRVEFEQGSGLRVPPVVYDLPLPSGRWYYYSLFFRTTPIDWIIGMSNACVLPRDYQHREHMWNVVPPFYQGVDSSYQTEGPIRQFLTVFGFMMDNTREFVEGLLDLHYIDKSPMRLLKGLGANYGMPYEAGIGDIRYRGLLANAPNAQHTRGTAKGLRQVIEAVAKYETEITGTTTLMMYPDDSDFYSSTGNWGGMHPATVPYIEPKLVTTSTSSVRLDGTAGTFIAGPSLQLGGTTTLRFEFDYSADDWTPAAHYMLANQSNPPSRSWSVTGPAIAGNANFTYGSGAVTYPSTVLGFTDGSRHILGGTWTADNGTNSTVQWTTDGIPFGTPVTAARLSAGLVSGSGLVEIGRGEGGADRVTGNIYSMRLYANDVLVASPDFTRMAAGQTMVKDAQGNTWYLQGTAAVVNPVPPSLSWDKIYLARVSDNLPQVGRGTMRVYTDKIEGTKDLLILCGDSRIRDDGNPVVLKAADRVPGSNGLGSVVLNNTLTSLALGHMTVAGAKRGTGANFTTWVPSSSGKKPLAYRDAIPRDAGISVHTGVPYGFSVWVQAPDKDFNVQPVMVWVGPSGDPKEVVDVTLGTVVGTGSFGATARNWHQYTLNGKAPAATANIPAARYMIPGIFIAGRVAHTTTIRSAAIDVCGAMVYVLGEEDSAVAIVPPDRYLTLGDPNEKLGKPKTGFEGFIIGSPKRR